mmetsp:Transcript_20559/g.26635  ORF Transcript_20559/g.26635 Transcript_20559/m.26635 type:complete len:201 (-) Transcript_20559:1630-2232(-)
MKEIIYNLTQQQATQKHYGIYLKIELPHHKYQLWDYHQDFLYLVSYRLGFYHQDFRHFLLVKMVNHYFHHFHHHSHHLRMENLHHFHRFGKMIIGQYLRVNLHRMSEEYIHLLKLVINRIKRRQPKNDLVLIIKVIIIRRNKQNKYQPLLLIRVLVFLVNFLNNILVNLINKHKLLWQRRRLHQQHKIHLLPLVGKKCHE